jgi:hypothetical protein
MEPSKNFRPQAFGIAAGQNTQPLLVTGAVLITQVVAEDIKPFEDRPGDYAQS